METKAKKVTIETTVNAAIEKVWDYCSNPQHITKWCNASSDWHVPKAENDLRTSGKFSTTMAAKDGSVSFDFEGQYTHVLPNNFIGYTVADGRTVEITFSPQADNTHISETFEIENQNPEEMQRSGWQAILDNFKKYTEEN